MSAFSRSGLLLLALVLAGALATRGSLAQEPATEVQYDCTAVHIPMSRGRNGAETVGTVALPPGFVPVGGTSAQSATVGTVSAELRSYVVACRSR